MNYATDDWTYAAECATKDGFRIGSSAWMQRIRELLPIIRSDDRHETAD